MAEQLTQSQIDDLIGLAKDKSAKPTKVEEDTRKIRKYDFYSPKKISKKRLKLLHGIYENYARTLSSHMTSLLRISCAVELMGMEEQRYYEFNNALGENDIITLINMKSEGLSEDSHFLLQIANPVALAMIDRILGGQGVPADIGTDAYTEIELGIYQTIAKRVGLLAKDAWCNYIDVDLEYFRYETNPRLVQTISFDEIVVIIVLSFTLKDTVGTINICLPSDMLAEFFDKFERDANAQASPRKGDSKKNSKDIMDNLKNAELQIKVNMGQTYVLLSDLFSLQVGDVINLNKAKDSEVTLEIEDREWFKGKLGVYKQNKAIKITNVSENLKENIGGEI